MSAEMVVEAPSPDRLFNLDFVLLWQGQLVSQVGNQAFLVAQMFWLMESTGSAAVMGLLLMSGALPGVLLGPLAGTLADRHSRKAILVGADLGRGIAVLALAVVVFTRPEQTGLVVGTLFGVAVLSGVLGAGFNPAIAAAVPDLVPPGRLQAANSLHQLSAQGTAFLGQAVGGVAYRILGAPLLFLVDGISYVLSAMSEAFLHLPAPTPAKPERGAARSLLRGYLRDTAEGFRYAWGIRGVPAVVLTATAVNFLFMPVFVLLPFYVRDVLGRSADWYGFLLAALSLGALAGLLVAGAVPLGPRARPQVLTAAFLVVTSSMAVLGLVHHPLLALLVTFTMGLFSSMINIFVLTLLQLSTSTEVRGRVMGLFLALAGAASPLGMGAGGILADLTGRHIPATFATLGLLAVTVVLISVSRPAFRELLAMGADSGTEP